MPLHATLQFGKGGNGDAFLRIDQFEVFLHIADVSRRVSLPAASRPQHRLITEKADQIRT